MKVVDAPLDPLRVEPFEPLPVAEPAGDDPGEALIKEAKQRARRRRLLYGAVAVVVAIAAVAAFTIPTSSTPPPNDATPHVPAPPAVPLGAPLVQGPDASSTLLTSWGQIHVGYAFVYADGRVIWYPDIGARVDPDTQVTGAQRRRRADGVPAPDGEFRYEVIERRLSPHGLELVRAGELTPRQFLNSYPDPHRREELWAEPTARLYEASTYAICHTPANLAPASAQLPASAQALLSGKQRTVDPKIGWSASSEPMSGYLQMFAELELAFPSDCFEVTAAEASTLYQILDANGLISHDGSPTTPSAGTPPSAWFGGSRFAEIRGGQYSVPQISSEPIYPHGQPVRWGG
jgi:hypothetical protein